ncbi:retinol-binding protein pinta [Stomoxys calcitrans]|uniref:retinol-binding protein pinta n=1 Tax=Stomoxys calcitrans TaxID=35570 RepID=UPI0027E3ADE3|nr:retinol-binding protein pinta [Stomoxys calcitrans]
MADIEALSEDLQKIAIEQLNEVPARIPEYLQKLKTWILKQPHLKSRTNDQFLIQFLRFCKYNLEEAKQKVDSFYTQKTKYPDWFGTTDVDRPKFREIHNLCCTSVLPMPLHGCGPRIVIYRYWYPIEKYAMEEIIETCVATIESFIMTDPYACICGVLYLLDMAEITPEKIEQYTPRVLKKLDVFYDKYIPFHSIGFYFFNIPPFAEKFFQQYLESLPKDFRKNVLITGKNINHITDKVPLKYLPKDYGGENGCLKDLAKEFNKVWDNRKTYFQENAQYGVDEQLREIPATNFDIKYHDSDWIIID